MISTFLRKSMMHMIVIACFCITGRSEPIRIVKLKTKVGTVELRKKFEDDDDWLKGFTATVQNVSEKAIARVVLRLDFPRPDGASETQVTYTTRVMWGRDPADLKNEALNLMRPGERVEAKLVEANLPNIKSDLKALGYSDQTDRVRLLVDEVIFADRSMWTAGEILYPDPSDPMRWINPKYPASKGQTWNFFRPTPMAASASPVPLLFRNHRDVPDSQLALR
jgi:hypothetical protein